MAPVQLYVYDLSQGMARILSPQLLDVLQTWYKGICGQVEEIFDPFVIPGGPLFPEIGAKPKLALLASEKRELYIFNGMQLDGIWHTGVVVYDKEYFFGGMAGSVSTAFANGVIGDVNISGVRFVQPGTTILGQPNQTVQLGETEVPESLLHDFLTELAASTFQASTYNLFQHNCNHFSNELSQFLTGNSIPDHILHLPEAVLSSPFGAMISSMFGGMNV